MKYEIEKEKAEDIFEIIHFLEELLTERISDLYEVKGGMQARHAYVLYRKELWKIKYGLKENLKPLNKSK